MKATINGIAVEGTPQEIAEYLKRMDDMRREGIHIKPPLGQTPEWVKQQLYTGTKPFTGFIDNTNYANYYGKCPNEGPCYCTGACKM